MGIPATYTRNLVKSRTTIATVQSEGPLRDGDIVSTEGYNSAGDGGANIYVYREGPFPGPTDGGFSINIGTEQTLVALDQTEIRPEQFGAVANGVSDDTVVMQEIFENQFVDIKLTPGKTYTTTLRLVLTNSHRKLYGGGTIAELGVKLENTINVADDGCTIDDITIEGNETKSDIPGTNDDLSAVGAIVVSADDVQITNNKIRGKTVCVNVDSTSNNPIVHDNILYGFMDADDQGTDRRKHIGVFINGGAKAKVTNNTLTNFGNPLLVGNSAPNGTYTGNTVDGAYDNGMYVSSGLHTTITANTFKNVLGAGASGIKTRGSYNIVANNTLDGAPVGIIQTGLTLDTTEPAAVQYAKNFMVFHAATVMPIIGETIRGADTNSTAVVSDWVRTKGKWSDGTAEGYIKLQSVVGSGFSAEEIFDTETTPARKFTRRSSEIANDVVNPAGCRMSFYNCSGPFVAGETVTGANGATATIASFVITNGTTGGGDAAGYIEVTGITGTFWADEVLTGSIAGLATRYGAAVFNGIGNQVLGNSINACTGYGVRMDDVTSGETWMQVAGQIAHNTITGTTGGVAGAPILVRGIDASCHDNTVVGADGLCTGGILIVGSRFGSSAWVTLNENYVFVENDIPAVQINNASAILIDGSQRSFDSPQDAVEVLQPAIDISITNCTLNGNVDLRTTDATINDCTINGVIRAYPDADLTDHTALQISDNVINAPQAGFGIDYRPVTSRLERLQISSNEINSTGQGISMIPRTSGDVPVIGQLLMADNQITSSASCVIIQQTSGAKIEIERLSLVNETYHTETLSNPMLLDLATGSGDLVIDGGWYYFDGSSSTQELLNIGSGVRDVKIINAKLGKEPGMRHKDSLFNNTGDVTILQTEIVEPQANGGIHCGATVVDLMINNNRQVAGGPGTHQHLLDNAASRLLRWKDPHKDVVEAFLYSGTPEAAVVANPGSTCIVNDTGAQYVKGTGAGNTGWHEVLTDTLTTDRTVNVGTHKMDFIANGGTFAYTDSGSGQAQLDVGSGNVINLVESTGSADILVTNTVQIAGPNLRLASDDVRLTGSLPAADPSQPGQLYTTGDGIVRISI